jgi:cytochrome c
MNSRPNRRFSKRIVVLGGIALVAAAGVATVASAQHQSTPRGWNYEIKDGKRVPKAGNRVTNPDGSWREEVRQGNCVTIKERSAAGEYKETRQCNPGNNPG